MRSQYSKRLAMIAAMALAGYSAHTSAQAQTDAKATDVMTAMKKALGGEQKLANVKTLSLRADYRREMTAGAGGGGGGMMFIMRGAGGGSGAADGGAQMTGKIEIDLELPDKYLRSDIGSSGFSMTRTEGFEGTRPFIEVVPNSPGMTIRVDNPANDPAMAKASLLRNRADAARLLLGLVGGTQPGFDVTYAYGGQAESPDGKADLVDITGPEGFKVRLFVDSESHLPLMLTYLDAEPRVVMRSINRGGGPGDGRGRGQVVNTTPPELTPEQRDELDKQRRATEAEPPKMVEFRLYFSDYRKIDGVSLPYHISRGTGSKTTEEWDVTSYKVNPSFKADRFKVGS